MAACWDELVPIGRERELSPVNVKRGAVARRRSARRIATAASVRDSRVSETVCGDGCVTAMEVLFGALVIINKNARDKDTTLVSKDTALRFWPSGLRR